MVTPALALVSLFVQITCDYPDSGATVSRVRAFLTRVRATPLVVRATVSREGDEDRALPLVRAWIVLIAIIT